jgi:hypothetical protein
MEIRENVKNSTINSIKFKIAGIWNCICNSDKLLETYQRHSSREGLAPGDLCVSTFQQVYRAVQENPKNVEIQSFRSS